MKTIRQIVMLILFLCATSTEAQKATLKINPDLNLQLNGNVGNYYQLESSDNLSNWSNLGNYFILSNSPLLFNIGGTSDTKKFFRARFLASVINSGYPTLCAEYDNVMVFLRGDVSRYTVTATHPTYTVTDYTLWPDFTNCDSPHVYPSYSFIYREATVFDIHNINYDAIVAKRETSFWRQYGMIVTVDGNQATKEMNMQQVKIVRYIPGSNGEWPIFFVLYCDGNMRLIPFPPVEHPAVSFGSSVIIGPTDLVFSTDGIEARPICEIESVDYRTASKTMLVTYVNGGTAMLDINDTTREHAVVKVTVNYPTSLPFCTLRSNYVSSAKCDTSTVISKDLDNVVHTDNIESFNGTVGKEWFFTRLVPSVTRNSSPDILITPE